MKDDTTARTSGTFALTFLWIQLQTIRIFWPEPKPEKNKKTELSTNFLLPDIPLKRFAGVASTKKWSIKFWSWNPKNLVSEFAKLKKIFWLSCPGIFSWNAQDNGQILKMKMMAHTANKAAAALN